MKKDIPKIVLPETKHSCPLCALELKGRESKCPRCGVPLSIPKEEEQLECPQCSFLAPFGSKSCPKCGIGFEEVPGPPPEEDLPPPPEPAVPELAPAKPVPPSPPEVEVVTHIPPAAPSTRQGLVNGRGAINGTGLVNGRGAINGTGLVNGTGMINGTKGETRVQSSKKQRLFITRWQFLAVLIALLIVIPTFVYLSYSKEPRAFTIDGDFGEWSSTDRFGVVIQASSAAIAVSEWSIETVGSRLFVYINTAGDIMSSSDVSSYYLFIDSDNSATTGYAVSGIGADYLMQLDGWNSSVQSTTLSEYGSDSDNYDWNSWDSIGPLSTAAAGTQLEAMADMSFAISESARFLLMTQNSAEQRAVSYTVPAKGGLLVVEMEAGVGMEFEGLVDAASSVSMVRLYLTAEGEGGTVESITPVITGGVLISPVEDITLSAGEVRTVEVLVDTSSMQAESLVTASLGTDDVISTFADVQIIGDQIKAYVISAPLDIQIDGAFADWDGLTTDDVELPLNQNDNIDITAVGAVNGTSHSSFYVSVVGEMCGGSFVPVIKEKPSGGGGGAVIPSRKTGEDILRIYIDSDMSSATGHIATLSSKVIGADYLIEVKGLNGKIVDKSLNMYSAGQWDTISAIVNAANDLQQLEVDVSSGSIGGSSSIDFIVETTDWRLRTDLATAVPLGAESLAGGVPSGASIMSWAIESPTGSSSATAMSYQRKMFYDGVNFWSLYFDGTTTVYRYSIDSGQTWTLVGPAFSGTAINEASLWYDSSSNIVYIVGDTATASTTIHVRRGVVSPAAHTITWDGSDSTPAFSTIALGGKNTYISKDSAGYIWIMTSNCTQTTPARYELSVFVSTQPDSVGSWNHSGNMLEGVVGNQPNVKGSVVNIGSGSDMLAVFAYGGNVASRVLTTSWSAETIIYAIGTANPGNTDTAPPSVVVDSKGVAHVVYGNGHEQIVESLPFIYYVYRSGASWSVPYRLDSAKNNEGNLYPTISVDSATGNVFAFWVATSGGVGLELMAKKNVSGTWSLLTLSSDTTSPKQYLTSIYSAPHEDAICWQWTQNTTGTIEVQFDKLPEFSEIALPVLGLVAVVVIGHRNRSSRRSRDSTKD